MRDMSRAPSRHALAAGSVVIVVVGLIGVGAAVGGRKAGPQRPSRDDQLLARVAAAARDRRVDEARGLERRLGQAPADLDTAVRLARLRVDEARRSGDPRLLGYAEAALAPWWGQLAPPVPVLLLRATIRQSRHEFAAALADLDALVARAPDEPQGWLTRAVVLTVRGRYAEARQSCAALVPLVSPLVVSACRAPIDGLTGHVAVARRELERALPGARPDEQAWLCSILGEVSGWGGDVAAAERHFAMALRLDPADRYARAAYADLLLDAGRPAEARVLVVDREEDDGLFLRLVLAEAALGTARAPALVARLRERFAASRQRGEAVHQREEARFALYLEHDAARALDLARAGWEAQREPWDARLFLESARAANRPEAAAPALAWLLETGFEGRSGGVR
jgi:Tfp pilus assembly protein PilF